MGVLTEEQLKRVWEEQGLKFRMWRFHKYLAERGLMSYVDVNKFTKHVYELLDKFFVQGLEESKDGKQHYPTKTEGCGR